MEIRLAPGDGTPIYRQIIDQVKRLLGTGRLSPGDEMPSVRGLAQQLLVNPNTIARAYRDLETMGILESRQGLGTFVSSVGSPLARRERLRILSERADALLTEARHLGFSLAELKDLLDKRDVLLGGQSKESA